MSAELVPLAELEDRDLDAWRELARGAVEPNPFFDPDFVLPAARGLGEWDDVAVARVREGGAWAACLPVRRYRRWNRLPLATIATWRHIYCLLGTPLLAAGRSGAELRAILAALRGAGAISAAALDWIPGDGPVATALAVEGDDGLLFDEYSRATLERRPQNDYLEGRVKGKHRREFRRLARGLEDELGGELGLAERDDEAAVEGFIALEASGWKGRGETALGADPGHADFFREISRAFAERGELELLFLEAGGRTAAARFSLLAGGVSFCFKVAYDESLKRFSPGRELELLLIDRFHERGELSAMDSCTAPGNELFNRLWPDRRTLVTRAYPAPGARGLLAAPVLRAGVAFRDRRRGAVS